MSTTAKREEGKSDGVPQRREINIRGHTREVESVCFSPDSQMLASGSWDKTVRVWNPSTGEEKRSLIVISSSYNTL